MANERKAGAHEHPFDALIRDAYERMTPNAEAEQRMLDALMAAQPTSAAEDEKGIGNERARRIEAKGRRQRAAFIALAACLALALVGIAGTGLLHTQAFNAPLGGDAAQADTTEATASIASEPRKTPPEATEAPEASNDADNEKNGKPSDEGSGQHAESFSVGPTPDPDRDARYLYVTLESGVELEIVAHDGEPLTATVENIETPINAAVAYNPAGETTPCFVHASTKESPYPYVVALTNYHDLFFAKEVADQNAPNTSNASN